MDTSNGPWLTGLGINQFDRDGDIPLADEMTDVHMTGMNGQDASEGPVTDTIPTINLPPPPYVSQAPPPPPRPSFLQLSHHPQLEMLENRMEMLFHQAERNQADRENRLQRTLTHHGYRMEAATHFFISKLRLIHDGVQDIQGDVSRLKRRVEHIENTAETSRDEARDAKRQATDEHNVVRGLLHNSDKLSGDRHHEMVRRLTRVDGSSHKMKRKVAKLGKKVKSAASQLRKLSDVVEKSGSAGDRRSLGCSAANFVCVHHHVVGSTAAHPIHVRDHDHDHDHDHEDGDSQQSELGSS